MIFTIHFGVSLFLETPTEPGWKMEPGFEPMYFLWKNNRDIPAIAMLVCRRVAVVFESSGLPMTRPWGAYTFVDVTIQVDVARFERIH